MEANGLYIKITLIIARLNHATYSFLVKCQCPGKIFIVREQPLLATNKGVPQTIKSFGPRHLIHRTVPYFLWLATNKY